MTYGGGLYYDRNNSLLGSLTLSAAENHVALNLYPGLFRKPLKDVGFWLVFPKHDAVRFGVASRHLLGTGIGFGRGGWEGRPDHGRKPLVPSVP